jgi:uncharacterized protein YggT (Ycf19 family)
MGVDVSGEIERCFMGGLLLTLLFMACDLEVWEVLLAFMSTVCRISETERFVYTFCKTLFKVISSFTFVIFVFDLSCKM